jgi:hypothetical protein
MSVTKRAPQVLPTYSGYANYPTWAVALWLGNEEPVYLETRDLVRRHVREAVASTVWTRAEAARFNLAHALKTWVRDELAPDLGATMGADLLGWAFCYVEWDEIAENELADYEDELKDDEDELKA